MTRLLTPRHSLVLPSGFRKPAKPAIDESHPLSDGLVAYWPLGDAVAGTTREVVGLSGMPSIVSGPAAFGSSHHGGMSLALNGSGQWVSAPASPVFDSTTGTWVLWVQSSTTNGGFPSPMGRSNSSQSLQGITIFFDSGGHNLTVQIYNTTGGSPVVNMGPTGPSVLDGAWHCIAITFSPTLPCSMYLDGVLLSTQTPSGIWTFNGQPILIGSAADSFWKNWLGQIEGVRVYNRQLSSGEITRLYLEPYAGIYNAGIPYLIGASTGGAAIALSARSFSGATSKAAFSGAVAIAGRSAANSNAKATFSGKVAIAGRSAASSTAKAGASFASALTGRSSSQAKGKSAFSGSVALVAKSFAAGFARTGGSYAVQLAARSFSAARGVASPSLKVALAALSKAMATGAAILSLPGAILARSFSVARGYATLTLTVALSARSNAQAKSTPNMRVGTGLSSISQSQAKGRGQASFGANLSSRSVAQAKGALAGSYRVGLSGRSTSAAKGAAGSAFRAALSGLSRAAAFGRGVLTTSGQGTVALVATSWAKMFGRAAITATPITIAQTARFTAIAEAESYTAVADPVNYTVQA